MRNPIVFTVSTVLLFMSRLTTSEGLKDRKPNSVPPPQGILDGQLYPGGDLSEADSFDYQSDESCSSKSKSEYIVLPPGYDRFKLPWRSGGAGPIMVDVTMEAKKVLDFDELSEHITLEMDFTVGWTDFKILDYRLNQTFDGKPGKSVDDMTQPEINAKKRIINDPEVLKTIWKPNIFFDNLISLQQPYVMTKPVKLKVVPEAGFIQYATRISVTVDCEMAFEYFPADTQKCDFVIRAYSYTSRLVKLRWHGSAIYLRDTSLQGFDVRVDNLEEKFIIDDWDDQERGFEALIFSVFVRRQLSYHIVQTYLVSTFYIIITCLCFLIPHQMVEARIGISMTTLLTLTAMFGSVRTSTPITSYVKAIDTWMCCCIFFVFLALSQFTFFTWLRGGRGECDKYTAENENDKPGVEEQGLFSAERKASKTTDIVVLNPEKRQSVSSTKRMLKYESIAFRLEKYSFIIFLLIFGIYTIVYWSWLLASSDYFNWKVNATMNEVS